jgi:hypothetical protein
MIQYGGSSAACGSCLSWKWWKYVKRSHAKSLILKGKVKIWEFHM